MQHMKDVLMQLSSSYTILL
uniref:Uncharacterized protein n=1 Tax=Arundo donax TaxID=35708 RepID=A0A0A9TWZ9_ARUDO